MVRRNDPLSFLDFAGAVLESRDRVSDRAHLCYFVFRSLARLLEPADLFGDLVALAAERFDLLLGSAPFLIKRKELRQVEH